MCSTVMMNDPIAMKYICIHISNIWYYEKNIQSTGTDEQKLRGIPIIGCNHTAAHFSYVLSLANHPCFSRSNRIFVNVKSSHYHHTKRVTDRKSVV